MALCNAHTYVIISVCSINNRGILQNKAHPRELDPRDMRFRGRIRVHLKNDDGSPVKEQFPTRKQFTCATHVVCLSIFCCLCCIALMTYNTPMLYFESIF